MFSVKTITTYYGFRKILNSVSLQVSEGEIVAVIGANGAGKTTLLKTIIGLNKVKKGTIAFLGQDITTCSPKKRISLGLSLCPEGRRLFSHLSVKDNILLGAYTCCRNKKQVTAYFEELLENFPILKKFVYRPAGNLSGGEQQMVAICRSLMSRPRLLLLDEPSLGLSPLLTKEILKTIITLNKTQKLSVLLIEQNAKAALKICHRSYVLETGRVTLEGKGSDLLNHPKVQSAYLGKGQQ
ncbi:MAG: ABC transporter ATP-binding protein [Desulfonauticus sp.]|nr:ABC transporter ATP-binding protein [Desulfonauticus sp.]